jgi:DNA-directed RNA polymerase sigma subunit (sigma70/sigma32)
MEMMARRDLDRVARCVEKLAAARDDFREAVRAARKSGETLDDIAKAAGLSRSRISQIEHEGGHRPKEEPPR